MKKVALYICKMVSGTPIVGYVNAELKADVIEKIPDRNIIVTQKVVYLKGPNRTVSVSNRAKDIFVCGNELRVWLDKPNRDTAIAIFVKYIFDQLGAEIKSSRAFLSLAKKAQTLNKK